jgi:hypothetical protein
MQFKMVRFQMKRTGKHMLLMVDMSEYEYELFQCCAVQGEFNGLEAHTVCIIRAKE